MYVDILHALAVMWQVPSTRLLPYVVPRQLAPRPLSNLSHVPVLFDRAVHIASILSIVATPEAHDCKAADDKRTRAEDNQEDDEGRGDLEAHVVSFVKIHGCSGVTIVDDRARQMVQEVEEFRCQTVASAR